MATYRVFVANWWRMENGQRVPDAGARQYTLARGLSEADAREMAQAYNRAHDAGPLSRKAEFDDE